MYNIVIFAHNEAKNLEHSLTNLMNNIDDRAGNIYLLANGCTDGTIKIANHFKLTSKQARVNIINVIEIATGDKCNAWNHYIHDISAHADCHFFVDADVTFSANCFPILYDYLMSVKTPAPNIVAGYPLSGRNLKLYEMLVEERGCFYGNLYGASSAYIEMIRAKAFYLPIGLNWIDSFLTKAANTDIQFVKHNMPGRVIHKKGVGFEFESLSPFIFADIKLYKNRIARYELGKIQEVYLDALPFDEWPPDMVEVNSDILANFEAKTKHLGFLKRILVKQRLTSLFNKAV